MSDTIYTYHLNIINRDSVQVRKIDENGQAAGNPSGTFAYKGSRKKQIASLCQKAQDRSITSSEIETLGQTLFDVLFDDSLRVDFLTTYNRLRGRGMLRVELGIDEKTLPDVAALPWEFLCMAANAITGQIWLGTDPNLVFSRHRYLWQPAPPIQLKSGEKLRIAVVVSTPTDIKVKVLYEKLWEELETLVGNHSDRIELVPLETWATKEHIDDLLEEQKPHVFHFVGHGRFHNDTGQEVGEIALMHESGQARWVDAPRFSTLFARYQPGVVLLQACEGGQLSASQAFTGVASQIVQQQIPVVVAMQYEISNNVARKFAAEFYKRLAMFKPVDTAAQEGRNRISDFNASRHFATPVLFMRAENGHLFERRSANPLSSSQEPLPESTEPGQLTSTERTQFREKLNKYFSQSELHTLCFDMSLDREQFPTNQGKGEFVLALVEYLERDGRTDELLNLCRQQRNHVQWP